MSQKDFIFVVGCPRSGTYLLSSLLDKHFDIVFPIEDQIIYLLRNSFHFWGNLSSYHNRKNLLADIYLFMEIWLKKGMRLNVDAIPYSLLSTKIMSESIIKDAQTFETLMDNLYSQYAKNHTAKYYGEKSVPFWHIPLEELQQSIPNLKVIHIMRDGRDVYLSWLRTWFGSSCLYEASKVWAEHLISKRNWGKKNADRYLEIKYENLLTQTDFEINRVSEFLNIHKRASSSSPHSAGIANLASGSSHHGLLAGDIVSSNFNKWKKTMQQKDRMFFEYIVGDVLDEFEYERENENLRSSDYIRLNLKILFGKCLILLSVNNLKRRIKSILPLLILFSRKLKIQFFFTSKIQ